MCSRFPSLRLWLIAATASMFALCLPAQTIQTVAGGAPQAGQTYIATRTSVFGISGVAVDGQGNFYVAGVASLPNEILKVTPAGQLSVYAGQSVSGYSGDGGPATSATLHLTSAEQMAVDAAGNLYFADTRNCVVRKVTAATGVISTVAGTGKCGFSGDGAAATSAQLNLPHGVALDATGNLYVADTSNARVREVSASTGVITTIAGQGFAAFTTVDSGPATQVPIGTASAVALDAAGNVFIENAQQKVVWKLTASTGQIAIVAGQLSSPTAKACASASDNLGDGCPASQALFGTMGGFAMDGAGNMFIGDGSAVREVDAASNTIHLFAGSLTASDTNNSPAPGDGGPASSALLVSVSSIAADAQGNVFLADGSDGRVRKVTSGVISTVAGNGVGADSGDGGPALSGQINPHAVGLDAQGNLYVTGFADVHKITAPGAATSPMTAVAGIGWSSQYTGDGGPATQAHLNFTVGVVADAAGNVIVADEGNDRIFKVSAATGVITTVAGTGQAGYTGDGGPATAATLNAPLYLAQDAAGDLYFSDVFNNVVREITPDGIMHTVAGTGTAGYGGDGGPALAATLNRPHGIALASNGDLYIADTANHVVRLLSKATGIITTVAGNGTSGLAGMNGPATAAQLTAPDGIGVDGAGNVFFDDSTQGVVLERLASDATLHLLSGNGTQMGNQFPGAAADAGLCSPAGLTADAHGNVFFADGCGLVVREIKTQPASTLSASALSFGNQLVGTASSVQTITLTNSGGTALTVATVAVTGTGFAQTNTCTAALNPGASCTVGVVFTPTATGIQPGTLTITDNAFDSPLAVTLSGTGTAASVSLSPASVNFGTQPLLNLSAPQTITVKNTGTAALTITGISVTGPFTQTNNCGSTLAAGSTCSVAVVFAPQAVGTASGSLTLTDSAADSPQSVALTGTGVAAPQISLSTSSLTFASQATGTTSDAQTVVVTNSGNAVASISGAAVNGPFTLVSGCGTTVAVGANCTLAVRFVPTATGAATGTLTLSDNAAGSPQTVALNGNGIGAGVTLAPSSLSFGSVTTGATSAPVSLTITNSSAALLTISSVGTTTGFAVVNACPTVQPGASCSLGVTFTPAAAGAASGTLTLNDNAAGGTQTVPLAGFGTAAGVALAPAQLTFAPLTVGQASFPQTVVLTNTGTAALTGITMAAKSGDFAVSNSTCTASLAAQAACTFQVAVTPSVAGADTATLALQDNLGTQALALSATGIAPGLTLSSAAINFGSQTVGLPSSAQTVSVSNQGTAAVSNLAITSSAPAFTQSNNCGTSLAAGAACTINVVFTPTAAGPASTSISVGGGGAPTLAISASGSGVQGLSLLPASLTFGNQAVGGQSAQQTINILNTGIAPFTLNNFAISGDFTVTQNLCTQAVAPGGLCQVFVAFAPSTVGTSQGSLTVTDSTGALGATVALAGQGSRPGIAATPAMVAFGSTTVGQNSAAQTVTITNTGNASLTLQSLASDGDFAVAGSTCLTAGNQPGTLAAGANCIVSLVMQPSSLGTRTGTLRIANDASGTLAVALTGSGQSANLTAQPDRLSFGSVPVAGGPAALTAVPQVVTVVNHGTSALTINSIGLQGGFSQSNTCGGALAGGASCTISVGFAPRALGNWSGLLTINTSDGATHVVSLDGLGSPNGLVMSPSALNFGGVAVGQTSAPQSATLTNNSGSVIASLTITASGEFQQTNTCGTSLATGASCTLQVSVTPALDGQVTGSLSINGQVSATPGVAGRASLARFTPDGVTARAQAALAGTTVAEIALRSSGNPAGLQLSSGALTFASVAVGSSGTAQTLTLTNPSASNAVAGLTVTSTPDFHFTTTCTATLAASGTCTIAVTFRPTAAGARTGSLNLSGTGGLAASVALSGTATGSNLAVSPASLNFGARAEGTTSSAQTLTLQNTGSAALSLQSLTLSNADFAISAGTCGALPASLAAQASCTLAVTFTPSTTASESSSLQIGSDAANGTVTVGLAGSGSTSGLTLSATAFSFGNQGLGSASAAQTLTLTNPGTNAVAITALGVSGDFTQTNNCGASLAAGASCAVQLSFTPTAVGTRTGALTINSSAAIQTATLSGTGTNFTFSAAATTLTAVNAGGSATATLTLAPGQFSGTVQLACSGAPANSTCSVAPASVALAAGGAAVTATVTLATRARGEAPLLPPFSKPSPWEWLALAGALLALLAASIMRRFTPRVRRRWLLGALAGACLAVAACGGGNNLPAANNGTPPGTYPMVITATSGTNSQTVTVNVRVY